MSQIEELYNVCKSDKTNNDGLLYNMPYCYISNRDFLCFSDDAQATLRIVVSNVSERQAKEIEEELNHVYMLMIEYASCNLGEV